MSDLLVLAHASRWDGRFQITSLAASAASVGERVDVALFFGALQSWVSDEWDRIDPASPLTAEQVEGAHMPHLSSMLRPGREAGLIRLYACSASARLLGLDLGRVQERVDAILGWQSFAKMTADSGRTVSL